MPDLLKNLKIDSWYKVFVYIGSVLLVLSIFIDVQWMTNKSVGLLALTLLFVGLGEWNCWKIVSEFKPPNAYTGPAGLLQYPVRKPDFIGITLLVIGFIMFVLFILEILK